MIWRNLNMQDGHIPMMIDSQEKPTLENILGVCQRIMKIYVKKRLTSFEINREYWKLVFCIKGFTISSRALTSQPNTMEWIYRSLPYPAHVEKVSRHSMQMRGMP